MINLEQRLVAGLEAQDWRETASRGPWRRFAKFGRGAMYVLGQLSQEHIAALVCDERCKEKHMLGYEVLHILPSALYFSELHQMLPQHPVIGPILQQLLQTGDKQLAQERPDTEALLIELLYQPNGGSK